MNEKENDAIFLDNYFQHFNVIFYAIVSASLLFFIIIFLNIKEGAGFNPSFQPEDPSWYYLAALACFLPVVPAYMLYAGNLRAIDKEATLQEKLIPFKSAFLVKYAFIEAGNILALVLLYVTEEHLFLIVYAIMLTLFAINRPTPFRIIKDLPLSPEEQKKVRFYRRKL